MNEIDAAGKHLFDTLLAHEPLTDLIGERVYEYSAPDVDSDGNPATVVYPFVVYSHAGGTDRQVAGSDTRMMTHPRWLVLAVHNQRDSVLTRAIASAADNALTGSSAEVEIDGTTYAVQTVYREEPVERGGSVDGVFYLNSGGYYRTPTQKLP